MRLLEHIYRPAAGFLGAFGLLNVIGDRLVAGFDINFWWIDLRPLASTLADLFVLLCSAALLAWAVRPAMGRWRTIATWALLLPLLMCAAWNMAGYYRLLRAGEIQSSFPVPLSLMVAAMIVSLLVAMWRLSKSPAAAAARPSRGARRRGAALLAVVPLILAAAILPLAQMYCFGKTDYRRPADVAVVFGAGVFADGTCSDALQDRVAAGCELYRQGLVSRLIFSGGPGQGPVHEVEAMQRLAVSLGVPAEAIELDYGGVNTQATVEDNAIIFRRLGAQRVLAVSHFYHLPRVKMTYQRAGFAVYTVPARETYVLKAMPYYIGREIAALWSYYLRPLK